MKWVYCLFFIIISNLGFSQGLKENNRLYFLGSYYENDTSFQMGLYITKKENNFLELKIQVAKNWKTIGEKIFLLQLSEESSNKNKFKIKYNNQKFPAYKFTNDNRVELLLLKDGKELATLKIEPDMIFGISAPKIFHQK